MSVDETEVPNGALLVEIFIAGIFYWIKRRLGK